MKCECYRWKVPVALGLVVASLVPILLLTCIEYTDTHWSMWAYKQQRLSFTGWTFQSYYLLGLILPILTTIVAVWFVVGKFVTAARLAWVVLLLAILHLFWLSWGILAFYYTNQSFMLH